MSKRRYRKVFVEKWGDDKFRQLSRNAMIVWDYLLTGPEVTPLPGLIPIGRGALSDALRFEMQEIDGAFGELASLGMARADWSARVVLLPNGAKWNEPESVTVVKSWRAHFNMIPECPLKWEGLAAIIQNLGKLSKPFIRAFRSAFQDLLTDSDRNLIDSFSGARARHATTPSARSRGGQKAESFQARQPQVRLPSASLEPNVRLPISESESEQDLDDDLDPSLCTDDLGADWESSPSPDFEFSEPPTPNAQSQKPTSSRSAPVTPLPLRKSPTPANDPQPRHVRQEPVAPLTPDEAELLALVKSFPALAPIAKAEIVSDLEGIRMSMGTPLAVTRWAIENLARDAKIAEVGSDPWSFTRMVHLARAYVKNARVRFKQHEQAQALAKTQPTTANGMLTAPTLPRVIGLVQGDLPPAKPQTSETDDAVAVAG